MFCQKSVKFQYFHSLHSFSLSLSISLPDTQNVSQIFVLDFFSLNAHPTPWPSKELHDDAWYSNSVNFHAHVKKNPVLDFLQNDMKKSKLLTQQQPLCLILRMDWKSNIS